jgi:hypothetical protein
VQYRTKKEETMKKMQHDESKETPEMESKAHSKGFLTKAAKLADRKLGSAKAKAKKKSKRMAARKRA